MSAGGFGYRSVAALSSALSMVPSRAAASLAICSWAWPSAEARLLRVSERHIQGIGIIVSGMYHAQVNHHGFGYQPNQVFRIESVKTTPGQTVSAMTAA